MALPAAGTQIRGIKSGRAVLAEEAARVLAAGIGVLYESHEFILASPTTNFSLKNDLNHVVNCSCGRAAFSLFPRADHLQIRNRGTSPVGIRLNDVLEDLITVDDGENWNWSDFETTDVLMTNNTGVGQLLRITLE
jgi:hypothetical protein